MNCYVHTERNAIGTCVGCGKFICQECTTEIGNKNYCKKCVATLFDDAQKKVDKLESKSDTPMVFMNAGGGGASSSSSSAAASAAAAPRHAPPYPRQSFFVHFILFCFTAGIGNILYAIYISSKKRKWEAKYS